jgi:hypothetical protein
MHHHHHHQHKKAEILDELRGESFLSPIPTTDPRIEIRNGEFCLSPKGMEWITVQLSQALAPLKNLEIVLHL